MAHATTRGAFAPVCKQATAAARDDAQAGRTSTNSKPSFRAAVGEALVERHDLERRRTPFGGDESRCKLERVGGPQGMNAKKPERVFADDLAGLDFVPPVSELFQPIEGQRGGFPIERSAALEAGEGGSTLHLRSPPHQHV
jgi:hypothetical protein